MLREPKYPINKAVHYRLHEDGSRMRKIPLLDDKLLLQSIADLHKYIALDPRRLTSIREY